MNYWAREYGIPGAFTLVLHVLLMAWLLVDIATQPKLPEIKQPDFVRASLVQLKQTEPEPSAPAPARQQVEEQRRAEQQRLEQQRREQAEREVAERRRVEEARRRAEDEQRRKAEAERAQQEQQRIERERREAEQRRQAELERQRVDEQRRQEALARQAREQALLETIAGQEAVDAEEDERRAHGYINAIQQAVIANWNRPPSARNDMEALLQIQLVPTGAVINVNVIESSGNDAFDRSAVAAVKRAERFPELAEMESRLFEKYFRNLRMLFKPEDLRL